MSLTNRPAAAAAVAFGAGIAMREAGLPADSVAATLCGLAVGLPTAIFVVHVGICGRRRRLVSLSTPFYAAGAATLLVASGYFAHDAAHTRRNHLVDSLARARVVRGTILGPIQRLDWGTRFDIRPEATDGRVRVTLVGDAFDRWSEDIEAGSAVKFVGPLDVRAASRNPADFNYAAFLFARGVSGAVMLDRGDALSVSGIDPARAGQLGKLRAYVGASRSRLIAAVDARVEGRSRSVIRAMLVGDRSELDDATRDTLARAGLMHLLAVSGLHVMLVGFVWYRMAASILRRLGFPWTVVEWVRAASTLAILCCYAALTGGSSPVVRAVAMGALIMGQALAKRRADTLNTLGVAALLLLAAWPPSLFDVGFQLSFAAVGSIVAVARPTTRLLAPTRRHPGFVASSIGVSVAATLGTAPIVANAFGFVPLSGILLNVAAVPLAAAALGSSILMLISAPLSETAASMFARTADWSARLILEIGSLADREFAFASISTSPALLPSVVVLAVAMTAIVHLARAGSRWKWTTAAILFVGVVSIVDESVLTRDAETLDVVFVDVGQGDAAIIRTPRRRFVVVDAGPPGVVSPASRSIVPLLRSMGAGHLSLLVVSHPHADHDGGVDDILAYFHAEVVTGNGLANRNGETDAFRGLTIQIDADVSATVLSPPALWPRDRPLDEAANNHSLVLRIDFGGTCLLFTGDIEEEAEAFLGSTRDRMDCEVVKVAHHGSRTSSTWPFISAVRRSAALSPGYAIISAGRRNRFGHPHEDIVARWQESGRHILMTSDGAQWLRSDGKHVRVHDWR